MGVLGIDVNILSKVQQSLYSAMSCRLCKKLWIFGVVKAELLDSLSDKDSNIIST